MASRNCAFLPLVAIGSLACALAARAEVAPPLASPEQPSQRPAPLQALPANAPAQQLPTVAETVEPSPLASSAANAPAMATIEPTQAAPVPVPGSAKTSASSLLLPTTPASGTSDPKAETVAQSITPGRATRSSSSYFGVGGNIGFTGDSTAVGNGSFVILSKIGLTDRLSARPAVLFGDNITILLPVTYDFASVGSVGDYRVAPYVGGGFAIATDSDSTFNLLATAGVDVPLGSQFTANAALNLTFLDRVSFGLLLGVGYNF